MKYTGSNDGRPVGRSRDRIRMNQGFEVGGLSGRPGDAQSLLELLPVTGIRKKKPGSFCTLLLQSLQNENVSVSIRKRQQRDVCVIFTRAASKGQPLVRFLLTGSGMQILEVLRAFAHYAFALLEVELVLK